MIGNSDVTAWPTGARLRFKIDAAVKPEFVHLRGVPVLVLTDLREVPHEGYRQKVLVFGAQCAYECEGWALPSQLEPFPDDTSCEELAEFAEISS